MERARLIYKMQANVVSYVYGEKRRYGDNEDKLLF